MTDIELFDDDIEMFSDDIQLFDDDIELFDDDVDFAPSEKTVEAIIDAAHHFERLFSGNLVDGEFANSSSIAVLLYQNLIGAGFKANISIEDVGSKVTAIGYKGQGLLTEVEHLLESITSTFSTISTIQRGNTIHQLTCSYSDNKTRVDITFVSTL